MREVHEVVIYYSPSKADMKKCEQCAAGWSFYLDPFLGAYVHKASHRTNKIVCSAVNTKDAYSKAVKYCPATEWRMQ